VQDTLFARGAPMPLCGEAGQNLDFSGTIGTRLRRLKILMTEGASLSARHSLYVLGQQHDVHIIDPNPLCQCRFSSLAASWRRSPHFAKEPADFMRFLAGQLRDHQYDVVLPPHEQVYLLSRFRQLIGQLAGIALPDFAAIELMQNKAHFARTLNELGLPQPSTQFVASANQLAADWQYPFYLKLAHSTAGAGVFLIANRAQLDKLAAQLEADGRLGAGSEAVVQQPAQGNQATVQAVFDHGRLVAVHCFDARQLGVGGMSSARTSADHPVVRDHVAQLGAHLGWHGALFIDYFYDQQSGQPQYLECNPRVGETVNAWLSGVNIAEQLVRLSVGEPVDEPRVGQVGVRTQSFLMILITAAYQGASRGELWRQWRAWRRGEGLYENAQDELTRPGDDPLSRLPLWYIGSQLLLWPGLAKSIVKQTVDNYSLPESATERIRQLDVETFRADFASVR
jgi:predicted ATP-grasp superfamily ATP-dependent carboligase